MPPQPRRFPPPWSLEELNEACFIVQDSNGQQLAYVYYEDEPGRRAAPKMLAKDEARRIASNIAKLPEPLRKP
jgi:DNA-directed RNA polymerase specialized sigma24 family protein